MKLFFPLSQINWNETIYLDTLEKSCCNGGRCLFSVPKWKQSSAFRITTESLVAVSYLSSDTANSWIWSFMLWGCHGCDHVVWESHYAYNFALWFHLGYSRMWKSNFWFLIYLGFLLFSVIFLCYYSWSVISSFWYFWNISACASAGQVAQSRTALLKIFFSYVLCLKLVH